MCWLKKSARVVLAVREKSLVSVPIVRRAVATLEITQDAFRMTFEPARTYHGDQEKVRGRDLLEVFRVSVSEPFNVNQSQHHGAWRDTRLPAAVKHMQTNINPFRSGTGYARVNIL